ncbi:immunity protein YezG family protein [Xanthomonas massiliensis]|uniref:immunity protein YezG family protein n=1 Tax=Xanthomonas massiliensis TaxID=1720302 RepID=UPI0008257270|nr:hypothetical protein [Xanthomonas massiliensis]
MSDKDIYSAVGKIMWSLMPKRAVKFELFGKFYDDFSEDEAWLIDASGGRFQFDFDNYPTMPLHEIMENMRRLRTMEPFKREPWTHFKAILNEEGKFKVEFAYVPREQDVIGVYMRGGTAQELADQQ